MSKLVRNAESLCQRLFNDMARFTRDDGVAYDRGKSKLQGIRVTTENPFAIFKTTTAMERDNEGTYENECKPDL